jgi:hypothetical protein
MRYGERQRTGVELGVDEREAPPILMSKLNAIALTPPLPYRSFMPQRLDRVES